ncbi:MAG: hypothetical protein CMH53_02265 [Myxococcales bacterium]|nr:hypothetical protein [Myxococcales bacterium]
MSHLKGRLQLFVLASSMLLCSSVWAGDYERNDVSARELGLVSGRFSAGDAPFGFTLRGAARRHTRFFYLAVELEAGATLRPGGYVALGGAVGLETAADAFTRLRGYAQLGVAGQWSHSSLHEVLLFHLEVGARIQLQSNVRPHSYLFVSSRASTNFNDYGAALALGVGWTFD